MKNKHEIEIKLEKEWVSALDAVFKKKNKEVRYANPEILDMGICEIPSSSGNLVKVYDKERCICDLIKDRKKYEIQLYQTAIKDYMSSKEKNLSRLIEYAVKLGVRDEVMMYVEVMVWFIQRNNLKTK